MSDEASEYRELRRTIASRGTWRVALMLAGTGAWAGVLVAVLVLLPYPLASAIPLLVLSTAFEVIRILHFGSERLGRYLQVFYEERGEPEKPFRATPSWERVAMAFGVRVPGAAGHPLFVPTFLAATAVNFIAVVLPGPVPTELAMLGALHLAFIGWLIAGDRAMRQQRRVELERFRSLHAMTHGELASTHREAD